MRYAIQHDKLVERGVCFGDTFSRENMMMYAHTLRLEMFNLQLPLRVHFALGYG